MSDVKFFKIELPLDHFIPSVDKLLFQNVRTYESFRADEISFALAMSEGFKVFYCVEVSDE